MKWILDNFTKLLGLLSFSLIAASTIHDWAYFDIVGSKFRSIQTTYDYITQAIEWMPSVLFYATVGGLGGLFSRAVLLRPPTGGLSGQGFQRFRRQQRIIAVICFCLGVPPLIRFSISPYPNSLYFLIFGLFILFSALLSLLLKQDTPGWFFLPSVAGLFYLVGTVTGIQDSVGPILTTSSVYRLQLKGASAERQVLLLRNFEKGILVRIPSDNQIELVRWDQVERLSHRIHTELEPFSCRWLHLFCREVVIP